MLNLLEKLNILDFNNPLPYPKLTAIYKDKPYIIDGIKRTNNTYLDSNLIMSSELDQVKFWLEINLKHRNILASEYIILINSIKDFKWNNYLNDALIKEYLNCKNFNTTLLKYLARNTVSLNLLKYLYTVKNEILLATCDILENFEINPSNLKNLLEYSNDIYIKTNKIILKDLDFIKLIKEAGINTALNYLYENRFYKLNNKRKEIKKISKNLKKIKLSFDNSFEENNLNFSFSIKNPSDIDKINQELNSNLILDLIKKYNE